MASVALRQTVYDLLTASPELNALGYDSNNIFPNFTPDGPQGNLFMVLRWGTVVVGVGPVNRQRLVLWVYNRQPDFTPIEGAIKVAKQLLPTLAGMRIAPGEAVVDVRWEGDTDDTYDDGYRAHARVTEHTITASGS